MIRQVATEFKIGLGYIGIDKIEGSFYNVMGLPVKELYEELVKF
jgi:septum formation protein